MGGKVSRPVALVSGAASGVGLATIASLIRDRFAVVGIDRAERPDSLAEEAPVEWVTGDVTEPGTWQRAVEASSRLDPVGPDCLISCAGDAVFTDFMQTSIEDYRRLFEINALGMLNGMLAVMPGMIRRRRGAIAVVCSVDSLYTEAGMSAYAASKAAQLQIVRSAALEHAADGLRINAVCPGAIDTPLLRRAFAAAPDPDVALNDAVRRIPAGEILRPEEVASVLRFLVSDAASGLSGAAVTIDGGLTSTYDFAGRPAR